MAGQSNGSAYVGSLALAAWREREAVGAVAVAAMRQDACRQKGRA